MDPLSLNIDINDHDASRKVLQTGEYSGLVKEAVLEEAKVPGNINLKLTVTTDSEQLATNGKQLGPGFPVTRWFPLQASPKQIEKGMGDNWKDDITNLVDALFGTAQGNRPAFDQSLITSMNGKPVKFTTRVKDDPEYGPGNNLISVAALS